MALDLIHLRHSERDLLMRLLNQDSIRLTKRIGRTQDLGALLYLRQEQMARRDLWTRLFDLKEAA